MNITAITSRAELAALAPAWDALARGESRDGFFRTFGCYQAWMEHIRPDAEPFVLVARDANGQVAGIAPLCRGKYRDLGFRLDSVFWATREVVSGDFLDFLCEPASADAARAAMLEFLVRERALLVLGELVDGGGTYAAVEQIAKDRGFPTRRQEERLCPYIALPATFDEYLNSLGSSTRYHIRRRTRDVEKKGARIEVFSAPDDVAARLEILVRLHQARWRKEGLPGTLERPGFAEFLRQVCSQPPVGSRSRLYVLNHEGVPVAALLAFYFGESALYYQAGWDPDSAVSALSPAVVLMAHSIRDAIQDGLRYYEFLRGDEAYKSRWTKTYRKTATLLVARSFAAREYLRLIRIKDAVKRHTGKSSPSPEEPADCVESQAT